MHIILVSESVPTTRTITITAKKVLVTLAIFFGLTLAGSIFISWLSIQFRLPGIDSLISLEKAKDNAQNQTIVRNNLQMMATRLGELQAQVLEMDSLSERLTALAGIKAPPKDPIKAPASVGKGGQGGPLVTDQLTSDQLQKEIERLAKAVNSRSDFMQNLETALLEQKVAQRLLPTTLPVRDASMGSGFGYRSDPFLGVRAMHQGIDFNAPIGTPVLAAAAGVITISDRHYDYGNMVEIDHGGELSTRYAHLSAISVKPGQIVKRGQVIGALGNTGRSTGPHLHFEVRMLGVPQNPARFLEKGQQLARR